MSLAVHGLLSHDNMGKLSIEADEIPTIVAPTLQTVPLDMTDPEFRMRNRHADMIVHPSERDVIYLRHWLLTAMREFFQKRRFIEVNTPLLQAGAGGAIARPFETYATELSDTKLNLRVAPELFLKRLIVGGVERVFEIGPAFRNEGVDATHNPEFTICEFYSIMTTLESLIFMTEELFRALAAEVNSRRLPASKMPDMTEFAKTIEKRFRRLEFIPTIEDAVRKELPDWTFPDLRHTEAELTHSEAESTESEAELTKPKAKEEILRVYTHFNITVPSAPTLPRLLDGLAAHFIEPLCTTPTFITHHPECMSPLAKSFFRNPTANSPIRHRVSARAELFIESREYVNCYEEENSPLEQRRKFEDQLKHRAGEDDGETHRTIDESYIGALEWGMPPTGGWGCGIDRIVMLFAGKKRIADVLPFGTLRNVVALGSGVNKNLAKETVKKDKDEDRGQLTPQDGQSVVASGTVMNKNGGKVKKDDDEDRGQLTPEDEGSSVQKHVVMDKAKKDKNEDRGQLTPEDGQSVEESPEYLEAKREKEKVQSELRELRKMLRQRPKE